MRQRGCVFAAIAATVAFACLALFQLALAAGASLGHAAWGGASAELSTAQRIGSAGAVLMYAVAIAIVLGRAGVWRTSGHDAFFRRATWVLTALFTISALANFASESRWENVTMAPLALVLALLCLVVARGPSAGRPSAGGTTTIAGGGSAHGDPAGRTGHAVAGLLAGRVSLRCVGAPPAVAP